MSCKAEVSSPKPSKGGRKRKADKPIQLDEPHEEKKTKENNDPIPLPNQMKSIVLALSFLPDYTYRIHDCGAGGNCLFRSISYQLLKGDTTTHTSLRKRACD